MQYSRMGCVSRQRTIPRRDPDPGPSDTQLPRLVYFREVAWDSVLLGYLAGICASMHFLQ